jgi:hypothetical protein
MDFDIAPGTTATGQSVVLRQFLLTKSGRLFRSPIARFTADNLHFASLTDSGASADIDKLHIQLACAFQKALVLITLPTAADGLKIDSKQWRSPSR